ncbi:MAG: preprotein translocase subunit SecG [Woeseiaceae bacterium]|nr:preprotein translocase subunit SecG [Woeseiaceae bacterium]
MDTTQKVVLVVHTLIAVLITVLVLLQRGKGADAGAGFGAGASGTVFGARGSASFFSRSTAVLAASFFLTSLFLAYLSTQGSTVPESLLENVEVPAAETVDADNVDALPTLEEDETISDLPAVEATETADEETGEQ